MTKRPDFPNVITDTNAFAAANALIEIDLEFVFDHLDVGKLGR